MRLRQLIDGFQRSGHIKMNNSIKLLRQPGFETMAFAVGFWFVNFTNRPFESGKSEILSELLVSPKDQNENRDAGLMKQGRQASL